MRAHTITIVLIALTAAGCAEQGPRESSARRNSNAPAIKSEAPTRNRTAPPPLDRTSRECDPNYSGCVPIASDVDCEGGSGNGPAYVKGPITVIGKDIYQLDRNGDGIGCE